MGDSACQSSSKANTSSTEFRRNKIYRWGIFVNYNSLLRKDISREIVEELENKKTRKKFKKTFYSDLSRNIAVSLG